MVLDNKKKTTKKVVKKVTPKITTKTTAKTTAKTTDKTTAKITKKISSKSKLSKASPKKATPPEISKKIALTKTPIAKHSIQPLFILIGVLLLGIVLDAIYGWQFYNSKKLLGFVIVLLGIAGIVKSALQFKEGNTPLNTEKPTERLIKNGLYRYSRNPNYLSFFVIGLGMALVLNNFWILILEVPSFFFFNRQIIPKEEKSLLLLFGKDYQQYCAKVRRWF
ncbi:MAG: isoprenylcysteine carboxylmethyltransferase family protein [SAR324 cluster bacterium]|nr:isoprenylcysteine carboxylmethyltransferase family protein [SAR324 cluster bacterium]